jgi:hypothetical protein
VVQHIVVFMDAAPVSMLVIVLAVVVLLPVHVLVHELGHGVAALFLTRGNVFVRVGAGQTRLSYDLGRLAIMAGSLRLGRPGGCCVYNVFDASSRTRGIVAACGPLTSIAMGILCAVSLPHTTGLLRDVCWWLAMFGLGDGVVNAVPLKLTDSAGNHLRTDGRLVVDALRGVDQVLVDRVRRDLERAAPSDPKAGRSIPPPA